MATMEAVGLIQNLPLSISVPLFLWLSLLIWRILRFTIIPSFYPDEPKEYPYWMPFVGHLYGFFTNSDKLLRAGRIWCGNSREVFSVNVAGSRLYVLTKATDVAQAYRNIKTLSFNVFVQEMLRMAGSTEFCIEEMYRPLAKDKDGFPNPRGKPLATLARDMHIHQLFPGANLERAQRKFCDWFDNHLSVQGITQCCPYVTKIDDKTVSVPLMLWCSDVFCRAGQWAYFGPLLGEIDPELTWKFLEFDELSYQIQFQYPKILSRKMTRAKNAVVSALMKYYSIPQEERGDDAWFIKAMENEMKGIDLSVYDQSVLMTTIYWGINTNTRKAAFWMISYMLQDLELYHTLREEVKGAFQGLKGMYDEGPLPNMDYLLEECPRLNAAWDETVRMSAFSASVRHVTEDTVIGGKLLRKGSRLMIPYRQLHFDAGVFGDRIHEFESTRFLKDNTLTKSGNWRPFGGGTTQCPGQHIAKRVVIAFVAMVITRFDVEMNGVQKFPRGQLGKPVLGIMNSMDEINVRLRQRV